MTELKTLKDLRTAEQSNYFQIEAHQSPSESKIWGKVVLVKDLKQEAIKWVKSIEQEQRDLGNYQKNNNKKDYYNFNPRKQGMISFIKKFFNLTEEDLEEKEK
jgi:predicted transcriptional regulator